MQHGNRAQYTLLDRASKPVLALVKLGSHFKWHRVIEKKPKNSKEVELVILACFMM